MKRCGVLLVAALACGTVLGEGKQLAPLPDPEGFAGSFAGVSGGALLVAGGANFPDRRPWEGGTKVWHDAVFVLEKPDGAWKPAGKLPRPLGCGVSVTHGGGVVCVGGSDKDRHHADAFRLDWRDGKLTTTRLPALPKPVANAGGALVGDVLYVAGGIDRPDATATLKAAWSLDLAAAEPRWKEVPPWPGDGRMLATAASHDGAFWLIGGVDLTKDGDKAVRRYLRDAYRYDPAGGWKRLADLPRPSAAAPSPAPADAAGVYLLGGDDGSQVDAAPEKHRGFAKGVPRYDAKADRWVEAGEQVAARVTVPCVRWGAAWVVPSGEARPGVRSPEVWTFVP